MDATGRGACSSLNDRVGKPARAGYAKLLVVDAVVLADQLALDLAADGLGQLVDELDDARVLVRGGRVLDVVLQLLVQLVGGLVAAREHDRGLDDLAAGWLMRALSTSKGPMR